MTSTVCKNNKYHECGTFHALFKRGGTVIPVPARCWCNKNWAGELIAFHLSSLIQLPQVRITASFLCSEYTEQMDTLCKNVYIYI